MDRTPLASSHHSEHAVPLVQTEGAGGTMPEEGAPVRLQHGGSVGWDAVAALTPGSRTCGVSGNLQLWSGRAHLRCPHPTQPNAGGGVASCCQAAVGQSCPGNLFASLQTVHTTFPTNTWPRPLPPSLSFLGSSLISHRVKMQFSQIRVTL